MRKAIIALCALFLLSSCFLPTAKKRWDTETLPGIRDSAKGFVDSVFSLVPGIGGDVIFDLSAIIPDLMSKGLILLGIDDKEDSE